MSVASGAPGTRAVNMLKACHSSALVLCVLVKPMTAAVRCIGRGKAYQGSSGPSLSGLCVAVRTFAWSLRPERCSLSLTEGAAHMTLHASSSRAAAAARGIALLR